MTRPGCAVCVQCGTLITSITRRRYCGNACRQAAHRARHSLDARVWAGTAIQRRRADGYVNATAMCQANGREWFTYARSERTKAYIEALRAVPQFCGTELVQSISGGRPDLQGTWIHPRLAVDLARWISPAFAVWMDGWFLEAAAQGQQQPRPKRRISGAKASVRPSVLPAIGDAERRMAYWAALEIERHEVDGDICRLMDAERLTAMLNHRLNAHLMAAGHFRVWAG